MEKLTILFLCSIVLSSIFITCASLDTISANQTITDGNTIVSAGQNFEMGFFSLGTSRKRYVGIVNQNPVFLSAQTLNTRDRRRDENNGEGYFGKLLCWGFY
ncbi:unnamed protein product [Lactuca virosa]|uniref:Dirigent protein n=1 Tax=Lactuca virosa TaxID=75947 RepID=A0AAU9MPE6_9ASTR|nr:unnamed protein product [Lactuca virosa]